MKKHLKIQYCGETKHREMIDKKSWAIHPEGTYTKDNFEWRFTLKPGDTLDAADNFGVWYKSTILEVQKEELEDRKYPVINVKFGFRIYDDNGNKYNEDEPERMFFGWKDQYDIERNVTDPRFQKQSVLFKFLSFLGWGVSRMTTVFWWRTPRIGLSMMPMIIST